MCAMQIELDARAGRVLEINSRQSATPCHEADQIRYTKLLLKLLEIHDRSKIHRQQPKHGTSGQFIRRQITIPVPIQFVKRIVQGTLPFRRI